MASKTERALQSARSALASTRRKSTELAKEYGGKLRDTRRQAKEDIKAERTMSTVEAIVGGGAAGVLDGVVDEVGGFVPPSVIAGGGAVAVGVMFDMPDAQRLGNGMLAGAAYGVARTVAELFFSDESQPPE